MNLAKLLEVLISGGGGAAVYLLLGRWPWFVGLASEYKRWVAIAASALVGVVAFVVSAVVMQYQVAPTDWRSWVEAVVNIIIAIAAPGAGAFVVSQAIHAKELRK